MQEYFRGKKYWDFPMHKPKTRNPNRLSNIQTNYTDKDWYLDCVYCVINMIYTRLLRINIKHYLLFSFVL